MSHHNRPRVCQMNHAFQGLFVVAAGIWLLYQMMKLRNKVSENLGGKAHAGGATDGGVHSDSETEDDEEEYEVEEHLITHEPQFSRELELMDEVSLQIRDSISEIKPVHSNTNVLEEKGNTRKGPEISKTSVSDHDERGEEVLESPKRNTNDDKDLKNVEDQGIVEEPTGFGKSDWSWAE